MDDRLTDPAVTVGGACDGSFRVSVADAGIGMTVEEIAAAIRPFGRVADGPARPYEGLGLGLTIVSRLIGLHGGRLTIASAPQEGQRSLSISRPRRQQADARLQPTAKPRESELAAVVRTLF